MKYITMLFIVMTMLLYSCNNAKANTAQKDNNQKINQNFYFNADNAYNYIKKHRRKYLFRKKVQNACLCQVTSIDDFQNFNRVAHG